MVRLANFWVDPNLVGSAKIRPVDDRRLPAESARGTENARHSRQHRLLPTPPGQSLAIVAIAEGGSICGTPRGMSTAHPPVPQHILARRAAALSRQIYASLPWGYRIAGLLVVLSGDSLDAFGKVIAGEMVLAAVRGMPDIGGKPAFDWIQEVQTKGADVLPFGTGRQFAAKAFKILLTRFGSPDVAQEAMSNVLLQVARRKLHVKNGASIHDAESYVITIALNAARDILRAQGRRRENPLVRDREDEEVTIDVEDPESFRNLDKAITPDQMRKMLRDLEGVHPRAADYVRALLDGDSATEIAEDWQVTPSYVSKFKRLIGPEIRRFVENRLRAASTPSYYRP